MEKGFHSFEFSGEIQFFTQACFHGQGTLLGVVWNIHVQAIVGVNVMYMYDPKVMVSQVAQEMWF